MTDDYKIGYRKPPQHSRFKKGRSGNPAGRPKGAMSLQGEVKRLLGAKTKIKSNGAIKTVPTARALCLALIQKAMAGDVRAFSKIVEITGPEMGDELMAVARDISAADLDIVRRALKRPREQTPGSDDPSTGSSKDDDT